MTTAIYFIASLIITHTTGSLSFHLERLCAFTKIKQNYSNISILDILWEIKRSAECSVFITSVFLSSVERRTIDGHFSHFDHSACSYEALHHHDNQYVMLCDNVGVCVYNSQYSWLRFTSML